MAKETEIERLVVRLVGDDSSYHVMMKEAAAGTDQLKSMGNDLVSRLGSGISLLNPTIGSSIRQLGMLGRIVDQLSKANIFGTAAREVQVAIPKISSYDAYMGITAKVTKEVTVATTLFGFSLGAVGVAAAAIAIPIGAAALYVHHLGKAVRDEKKAVEDYQKLLVKLDVVNQASVRGSPFMEQFRGKGESVSFAQSKYAEQQQKVAAAEDAQNALRNIQETEIRNAEIYTDKLKRLHKKGELGSEGEEIVAGSVQRQASIRERHAKEKLNADQAALAATLKLAESKDQLIKYLTKEAEAISLATKAGKKWVDEIDPDIAAKKKLIQLEQALNSESERSILLSLRKPVRPGHELVDTYINRWAKEKPDFTKDQLGKYEKDIARLDKADIEGMTDAHNRRVRAMDDLINRIGLLGVAQAKQAAYDRVMQQTENEAMATKEANKAGIQSLKEQQASYAETVKRTRIEQSYFTRELEAAANSRDRERQSIIEVNKAYELWKLAHTDLTKAEKESQRVIMLGNAAHALQIGYVKEAQAAYERFKDPLDRIIDDQKLLRKLFESGGFGEGVKGAKAYERALMSAYAQAHKDYTARFAADTPDVTLHGSDRYYRELARQKQGMTPIPINRLEEAQREQARIDGDDKEIETLKATKEIAVGIKELVGQGKKKPLSIPVANF